MSAPKVFCYVSSWARDRPGRGRFTPADLDPSLCTHVVWAFAKIINGGVELPSPDQDQWDEDSDYQQLLRLREANPQLKVTDDSQVFTYSVVICRCHERVMPNSM